MYKFYNATPFSYCFLNFFLIVELYSGLLSINKVNNVLTFDFLYFDHKNTFVYKQSISDFDQLIHIENESTTKGNPRRLLTEYWQSPRFVCVSHVAKEKGQRDWQKDHPFACTGRKPVFLPIQNHRGGSTHRRSWLWKIIFISGKKKTFYSAVRFHGWLNLPSKRKSYIGSPFVPWLSTFNPPRKQYSFLVSFLLLVVSLMN